MVRTNGTNEIQRSKVRHIEVNFSAGQQRTLSDERTKVLYGTLHTMGDQIGGILVSYRVVLSGISGGVKAKRQTFMLGLYNLLNRTVRSSTTLFFPVSSLDLNILSLFLTSVPSPFIIFIHFTRSTYCYRSFMDLTSLTHTSRPLRARRYFPSRQSVLVVADDEAQKFFLVIKLTNPLCRTKIFIKVE